MRELIVISKNKETAYGFGFLLGMSSANIMCIDRKLNEDELVKYNDFIYVHSNDLPDQWPIIDAQLSKRSGDYLGDVSRINKLMESLRMTLLQINSLYSYLTTPEHTKLGCKKLEDYLIQLGYTKERGYEFQLGRDRSGNFYIHPVTDKMAVIIDIFKAYINKLH